MSLANAFRNALVKRDGLAGTVVYLPFTQQCNIGDIGRVNGKGWTFTHGHDSLPISVPKTVRSGISKLVVNSDCEVTGSLEADASALLEDGGKLSGSAKITFHKKTSMYFFVPAFYTEEVEMGPAEFGDKIWDAMPKRQYKLFDNCVYRTYRAQAGIFMATRSAGTSLTLNADYKNVAGKISGQFTVSNQTNDVVQSIYNPDDDPNGKMGTFACDVFRWRAAGKVTVNPKF